MISHCLHTGAYVQWVVVMVIVMNYKSSVIVILIVEAQLHNSYCYWPWPNIVLPPTKP